MPADSVSRALAAAVATDTLRLEWSRSSAGGRPLRHPRTVRFAAGQRDTLYVSDAEAGFVFAYDTSGAFLEAIATVKVPYLAGVRGDTLAVFDPSGPTMHLLVGGETVRSLSIQDADRSRSALVYGAFGKGVYYKRVDDREGSFVASIERDGSLRRRHTLPGPQWRHAGLLRTWGDTAVSLSGFRPVVDIVSEEEPVDTLALRGFDSPMFSRTRSFLMGDVHEPPLLSSSAAPEGDRLFVLNMRAGWLHIDVFNRAGDLVRRLTEGAQEYRKAFFPQDVDVRRREGSYAIAVVFTQPEPEVRLYTWRPPE